MKTKILKLVQKAKRTKEAYDNAINDFLKSCEEHTNAYNTFMKTSDDTLSIMEKHIKSLEQYNNLLNR